VATELISNHVITIAHRGDPMGHLDNTMEAFESAVLAGADMIELDLRRCHDGMVVCLHDETLKTPWGIDRPVADMTWDEVGAVTVEGYRIPTFDEALAQIEIPLMVDFTMTDVVDDAVRSVREADAMARCLFVSGNFDALRQLRAQAPEARIGMTWMKRSVPGAEIIEALRPEYWNPPFQFVTPERVEAVHELGLLASTWTVDETYIMKSLKKAGVDAIVSNDIEKLRRFADAPLKKGWFRR
jgi:glycerophosphoryl diester phosphodiesterase